MMKDESCCEAEFGGGGDKLEKKSLFPKKCFLLLAGLVIVCGLDELIKIRHDYIGGNTATTVKKCATTGDIDTVVVNDRSHPPELFGVVEENASQQEEIESHAWMEEYIKFHIAQIETVVANPNPANASHYRLKNNTRYLIWTCRPEGDDTHHYCGGLGDRFRGILHSLYLAMSTNRVFLISYSDPSPLPWYLIPNKIQWLVDETRLIPAPSVTIRAGYRTQPGWRIEHWRDSCELLDGADGIKGVEIHSNMFFSPREVRSGGSCMKRYWSEHGPESHPPPDSDRLTRIGFWTLFQFSKLVQQRADQIKGLSGMKNLREPYIAVHIRSGVIDTRQNFSRFASARNDSIYDETVAYSVKMRQFMKRCNTSNQPAAAVYVASDSDSTKRDLQNRDPSYHIVSASDMTLDHTSEGGNMAGHLDAWAEIKILIESYCIIRSRSGFSNLAVWFSKQKQRCIGQVGDFGPWSDESTHNFTGLPCNHFD